MRQRQNEEKERKLCGLERRDIAYRDITVHVFTYELVSEPSGASERAQ